MASASDTYQESNHLECNICHNRYNADHCPKLLACSHTFCEPCVNELISTQKKECPECKKTFRAEEVYFNRSLLEVAKQPVSKRAGPQMTSTNAKKLFLITAQDFRLSCTGKGNALCQETEVEVNDCIETNTNIRGGLEGLMQTLGKIKCYSGKTKSNIDQDNKLLTDKMDVMKGKGRQIKDLEDKLEAATDFTSAAGPMDEAGKVWQSVNERANEIKQLLQENKDNMKQDISKIRLALEDATKDLEKITEEFEGENSVVKITVHDFHSFCGCLRKEAPRGIFAVMTFIGTLRLAPVKIEPNNQVFVPHLEEGVLPPRCFVIELESLIRGGGSPSPSPPLSSRLPRGFLDLVYGPTPLGRVIISVTVNGLKGRNFLVMCAGGMGGASYAHSRVSKVKLFDNDGEDVLMGHYVSHGGEGGGCTSSTRAVLPSRQEHWEKESRAYKETPRKAGNVRGDISFENASAFWISTRDNPRYTYNDCFGMVEEGLDVLKSAISKYKDIKQVEVANCGLIL